MTRRITVSALAGEDKTTPDIFSTEYNAIKDDSLTPVGTPNTDASWRQSEEKRQPEEIRFTKRQAELAAHVAKTWQNETKSWSDFTQHTTFHGIKYIFDNDNPHKWRRYVWIVCVVAAISTFLMNFGQTMTKFFAYETNVGVQILYKDTCPLPAVTICNQNNYRITVANGEHLYSFIDEFYGTDDISDLNVSSFRGLQELSDSESFLRKSAHQLEDFVDKCTWKSKRCNLATDFEITATDLGICYTFNSGNDGEVKSVMDSGSSVALSLILNVEQYEYMRGPQNDAGVKILLHDQGEFPGAKDLGFAAAPGTHTLVGIHRTQVQGLPYPHGTCEKGAEPVPNCKLKCKTKAVYNKCGCRDIYMSSSITLNSKEISVPVCNGTQLFFCVQEALGEFRSEQPNCNCPVPCDQINYEPSLSYAQLSQFNVDRLVLTNYTRRTRVKKQFKFAKEITQRVDATIVQLDNEYIDAIQTEVSLLQNEVKEFTEVYTTKYFENMIMETSDAMEHDAALLFNWMTDILIPFAEMPRNIHLMKDSYDSLKGAMKLSQDTQLSELYEHCEHNLTSPDDLDLYRTNTTTSKSRKKRSINWVDWRDGASIVDAIEDYMEGGDVDGGSYESSEGEGGKMTPEDVDEGKTCDEYMQETFASMLDFPSDFAKKLVTLETMKTSYEASIATIFPNVESNADAFVWHTRCLAHITEVQEEIIPILSSTTEKLNDWVATKNINALIPKTAELEESVDEILEARVFDADGMNEQCFWISGFLGIEDLSAISMYLTMANNDLAKVLSRTGSLVSSAETIQSGLNATFVPHLEILESYRNYNSSKIDLANVLTGDDLDDALKTLKNDINDLTGAASTVAQTTRDVGTVMFQVMSSIADYDVSIIREDGVAMLQLPIQLLRYDPDFTPPASSLEMETAFSLQRLFNVMMESVTKKSDNVGKIYETMKSDVSHYKKTMETYLGEVDMNINFYMGNFLQVDVFYKELKYELIKTNEAFSRGSLFGEIGGFLGLLLGASVLTMCEVLDHIILTTVNWCAKRKGRNPTKKKNNLKMMF
ncbi:hypothetical protein CAPTEDRAFT_201141 [Capitella teleta]|uniref:Uncharacterized protein n=1 Tax=Capitella teleta TaxID=283909 RepID=R7VA86_CAPTE|nr:hypothetical protein CAPTEDRAFT_201141 [Capitella teleta]|eukprot:ELU15723.1 hypothetical protein CAPTEDRAFT_201141 [Capitella teleta]